MAELTAKQRKECLYAQQGELDAVLMYQELAKVVKDPKDAETFKQLAAEEGRHASVFHELTQEVLKPKKTKAVAVPMMYKICGKKFLYPIIANQEYAEAKISRSQLIRMIRPQASFLIFLDFRRLGLSQKELVDFVVDKAHLALNDGAMFGAGGEGFMRLNVGCPRKTMERAMTQLKAAFDKKYKL